VLAEKMEMQPFPLQKWNRSGAERKPTWLVTGLNSMLIVRRLGPKRVRRKRNVCYIPRFLENDGEPGTLAFASGIGAGATSAGAIAKVSVEENKDGFRGDKILAIAETMLSRSETLAIVGTGPRRSEKRKKTTSINCMTYMGSAFP
jgi:hypothetical protein